MENTKSEFQLNVGVIIPVAGTSDAYSNHNLTDELAVQLLAQNPNRKVLFSKLPENVDQLIEEYVASIEVSGSDDQDEDSNLVTIGENKITIEEALSLLESINVKSKATTVVGVSKKIAELSSEPLKEFNNLVSELVTKRQPSTPAAGVKTMDDLKAEYDVALNAFQELEVSGSDDEKAAAFKVLEDAQVALEEAEKLINKG